MRLRLGIDDIHDVIQRIGNVTDDFRFRLEIAVDICRSDADVDNLCFGIGMPFERCTFDKIITDCNHKICLVKSFIDIITLRNPERPEIIWTIAWQNAFCHHGIGTRNVQTIHKTTQCIHCMGTHNYIACQNDRSLSRSD